MISAFAFVLLGLSGYFDKVIRLIPAGIASGLLAGILLQFGIGAFATASVDPLLAAVLITVYLLVKRALPRYAIVAVLLAGLVMLSFEGRIDVSKLQLEFAMPILTAAIQRQCHALDCPAAVCDHADRAIYAGDAGAAQ